MKPTALTGLSGLNTGVDRLAGGANLKLSGAKDSDGSARPCLAVVNLPSVGFDIFFLMGGRTFALATVATEGWPWRRVGWTSGAAVYGQKAVVYFATSCQCFNRQCASADYATRK